MAALLFLAIFCCTDTITHTDAMIDRVAVLLLAGSALFGAVLLGELNAKDPGVQPAATPAPTPAQAHPAQLQSPRMDELVATTLSRPLFTATRRPAERGGALPSRRPRTHQGQADRHRRRTASAHCNLRGARREAAGALGRRDGE